MKRPIIGITVDNLDSSTDSGKYVTNIEYSRMIAEAGGLPVFIPQEIGLADFYVAMCHGVMLTGGDDVRSEKFGIPAHPQARCMAEHRQDFEFAFLEALDRRPRLPVLGVCLGMQLMAMHAGGKMHQHLPDLVADAADEHQNNHAHPIQIGVRSSVMLQFPGTDLTFSEEELATATVISSHHQGVIDAGKLRVIATAPDGVIEAIDDPARPYYVGVQWHPERGQGIFNFDLIQRFVEICAENRA